MSTLYASSSRFPWRVVSVAVAATCFTTMPVHLVGAYALQLESDLGLTTAGIGYAASIFYLTGGLLAPLTGRGVQSVGWKPGLRVGVTGVALAMLSIAFAAQTLAWLFLLFGIAGFANSVGQASVNMMLAERANPRHQGLSFGLKQSSIPLSTMLVGFSVPLFAVGAGWRWAFAVAGISCLITGVFGAGIAARQPVPADSISDSDPAVPPAPDRVDGPRVALLTATAFFGGGTTTAATVYLISGAVAAGWTQAHAGLLLSVSTTVGFTLRVLAGAVVDRRQNDPTGALAWMLATGMIGFPLLLVDMQSRWLFAIGAVLVLGTGWGWAGLLHFSLIRGASRSAASSTGILLTGVFLGGVVLPSLFGVTAAATASYSAVWLLGAAGMAVATGAMVGVRRLERHRRETATA